MLGLLGKPRAGKSFMLQQIVLGFLAKGQRVFIVDPDGAEQSWNNYGFKRYNDIKDVPNNFQGAVIVAYSKSETFGTPTFPYLQSKLDPRLNGMKPGPWANTVFVLDDANVYARGTLEDSLEWLISRKRQFGGDIITTAHSWGRVSPAALQFIDVYGIGVTNGTPAERSDVIKGEALTRTMNVRNRVNALKRSGKEQYPWKFIDRDGFPFEGEL